ncbi:hypothetical protein [Pseudomonas veronii]
MKTTMVGVCLVWAVFTFFFYRGYYLRWVRHSDYAEFAKATFAAVQQHFEELKAKRQSGIIDRGFKMIDESAWRETVSTFVTNVVFGALKPNTRSRIKASQAVSTSFTTFTDNFVRELTAQETFPKSFDLNAFTRSIESDTDAVAFFSGEAKYLPGKAFVSRLAALILAVGLFIPGQPTYAAAGVPFSPLDACNALTEVPGFQVNASGYSELSDGVYSCATPYKELGTAGLPNNLALYGRGTSTQVTRVKIMLNVNQTVHAAKDTKVLAGVCSTMVTNLVGTAPADMAKRVGQGKPFEDAFNGYRIFLSKSVWSTGRGYELNCGIATMDHKE